MQISNIPNGLFCTFIHSGFLQARHSAKSMDLLTETFIDLLTKCFSLIHSWSNMRMFNQSLLCKYLYFFKLLFNIFCTISLHSHIPNQIALIQIWKSKLYFFRNTYFHAKQKNVVKKFLLNFVNDLLGEPVKKDGSETMTKTMTDSNLRFFGREEFFYFPL